MAGFGKLETYEIHLYDRPGGEKVHVLAKNPEDAVKKFREEINRDSPIWSVKKVKQ